MHTMPTHSPHPYLALLLGVLLTLLGCPTEATNDDDAADDDDDAADDDSGDDDVDDPSACDPHGDHIDANLLAGALAWIDDEPNYIDSFIVSHCNEIQTEAYYRGYDEATLHDLQSATKTFSAVLIGIAIDQGLIEGVEQPLVELLPDYAHLLTGDKAAITVEHTLTMTTGLRWVDFGLGNSFDRIAAAEDSVEFILGEPLETAPGEVFHYNTGSSHLLSAILHHNSGMTTAEFAELHLFGPLVIDEYSWPALQDGVNQGGWGLHMRPRDFLKLGQALLDGGVWDGQQVVDEAFVDAATAHQVATDYGGGYGYQMWIETQLFDVEDIAGARGWGGQDCLVLDDLDLVVVFTGDIAYPYEMAEHVPHLVNEYVIPAHVGLDH